MKTETVLRKATQGQFLDIVATIVGALPKELTFADAKRIISNKGIVVRRIRKVLREFMLLQGIHIRVRIGGDTKETLLKKLSQTKVKVWATGMINNPAFQVVSIPITVNLLIVTIEDLGFTEEPDFSEVLSRGIKLGYQICHPEVGPQLWLQRELVSGLYYVAMNPLHSQDCLEPFYLSFPDGWLGQGPGMKAKLPLDQKIIFTEG